jgi:hypothetical protein
MISRHRVMLGTSQETVKDRMSVQSTDLKRTIAEYESYIGM